ncbi:hypothetical protein IW262DRAFT_1298408 [Armillaria fumosa]|nr:hypothetical protein IW262DRAFT_1298408 [Armillaria fumosa]
MSPVHLQMNMRELNFWMSGVPLCPRCRIHRLNLPVVCNGTFDRANKGRYYTKCPGFTTPKERAAGHQRTCRFFCWVSQEKAERAIFQYPEWEVHDFIRRQNLSNDGIDSDSDDGWPSFLPELSDSTFTFQTAEEMDSSSRTPNKRQHCKLESCNAIAHKTCQLCKAHCLQDPSFVCPAHGSPSRPCKEAGCKEIGDPTCGLCKAHCINNLSFACGVHGYPNLAMPPRESVASAPLNMDNLERLPSSAMPDLPYGPPVGIENRTQFSRQINSAWGEQLVSDRKFAVEAMAGGKATGSEVRGRAMGVTERAKRRDQVLSEKERAIQLTLFYKDGVDPELFQLFVDSKDWPFFFLSHFSMISRVCGVSDNDLGIFQQYEDGRWINYEQKIRIHRDERLVLRLPGVRQCAGFEGKKCPRTPSISGDSATDQPSPTKTLCSTRGVPIPSSSLPPSPVKALTAGVQAIDIDGIASDDDDDEVILMPRPFALATKNVCTLPAATSRSLANATPSRTGENGWPFMWAIDQHECFAQVEALIGKRDIKVREAFLEVVPISMRLPSALETSLTGCTNSKQLDGWKGHGTDIIAPGGVLKAIPSVAMSC